MLMVTRFVQADSATPRLLDWRLVCYLLPLCQNINLPTAAP